MDQLWLIRTVGLRSDAAFLDLRRLDGIGPFYATLIALRACGFTDAWLGPAQERMDDAFTRFSGDADPDEVAELWRPFRTWAQVLLSIAAREQSAAESDRP